MRIGGGGSVSLNSFRFQETAMLDNIGYLTCNLQLEVAPTCKNVSLYIGQCLLEIKSLSIVRLYFGNNSQSVWHLRFFVFKARLLVREPVLNIETLS